MVIKMKKLYLFLDEVKDNLGDIILNTAIMTFAAVFISFALFAVNDFLSSLLYYTNPNTVGTVKIFSFSGANEPATEITGDYPELEYSVDAALYSEAVSSPNGVSLITLSDSFFDSKLGLGDSRLYKELSDVSEGVKLIAAKDSGLKKGQKVTLSDGTDCTVAAVWDSSAPYDLINIMVIGKGVIALNSALDCGGFQPYSNVRVGKTADPDAFIAKYSDIVRQQGLELSRYDGLKDTASKFEGSITLTVLSVAVFVTACVAILINNYLSYEKRKKTYELLLTFGSRRKTFLFISLLTRILQLIVSAAACFGVSDIISSFMGSPMFSSGTAFAAILTVALLSAVGLLRTYAFLKKTEAAR